MRYTSGGRKVDAILFDGSSASAAEISGRIGSCAHNGAQLEVAAIGGNVFAGAGCWIVRDCASRQVSVVDDRHFARDFTACA